MMERRNKVRFESGEQGASLVVSTMLVAALAATGLVMVQSAVSSRREGAGARRDMAALYTCEAGLSEAVFDIMAGGTGNVGTEKRPSTFGDSSFYVSTVDLGNDLYQVTSDRDGRRGHDAG